MRPTRLGYAMLAADALAFLGGLISGNNLLYLVAGTLAAAAGIALWTGKRQAAGVIIAPRVPEIIYRKTPFRLAFEIPPSRRAPLYLISVIGPYGKVSLPYLPREGSAEAALTHSLEHRGINRVDNLAVESVHPFGLFLHRRRLPPLEMTAYPAVFEIFGRPGSSAAREEKVSLPRRGSGDDLLGVREYAPGEDARLINWKLTAKTGRPLVNEFSQDIGNRVTLFADGTPGSAVEERLEEAASLAKFFIDEGTEVRLVTNEGTLPYGRGLLHLQSLLTKLALLGDGKTARRSAALPPPGRSRPAPAPASRIRGPLYATTALAFASLFLIPELPPFALALAGLILPLGWLFDRVRLYPIPRIVFDAGAALALVLGVFVALPAGGVVRTVAILLLYVLTSSLWSPKTERGVKRILLTCFLLFFLSSGQAVDLIYVPLFVAFVLSAALWLERWHDVEPGAGRRPGWRRGVFALAGRCLLAAAALFVVLPRIYSPRMQQLLGSTGIGRFQNPQYSFAGLGDGVDLGFFGRLRKNSARAMRLGFAGTPPGSRLPETLHVRAAAFDSFSGRSWGRTTGEFEIRSDGRTSRTRNGLYRLRGRRGLIVFPGYNPEKPSLIQDITVYPMIGSFVFSAGGISALETDLPSAAFDDNDTVVFPYLYTSLTRYRVLSQTEGPAFGREIAGYADLVAGKYLRLERPDARWTRFARDATSRFTSPEEKARALERVFQTRFSYSLAAADNRQDLDAFLWTTRAGNCEYFASAMALLLRHLEIPSRLAVGFLATEWNEAGGFFDVRQSDAHAWVEAYLPDRGWTTFDPTPPGSAGGRTLLAAIWGRIRKTLDSLETRWYRYVVGFDSETQRTLLLSLRFRIGRILPILLIIGLGLAVVILALVLTKFKPLSLLRARRERRRRRTHFFYATLDRLARRGYRRSASRTAREFAEDVVRRRPDLDSLLRLADLFAGARYSGRGLSASEEEDAHLIAADLALRLRRSSTSACSRRPSRIS